MQKDEYSHIIFRKIRPRFKIAIEHPPGELIAAIRKELAKENASCSGTTTANFASIFPLPEHRHYWSPQLTITIEQTENGSFVRGLYGPKPSVWTMFVFFYSLIGFATLIVLMIGLSYLTLDQPAPILWLVPALLLVFLSLYLVAYTGQKLGQKQMGNLHRFMEQCFKMEINLS